jgi:hypothetical protein
VITRSHCFCKRLITVASHPTSPKPERPKIFNKRQSLREKRHARVTLERPASDSNISYASHNELAATQNQTSGFEYPEMPGDVPDWIRRRSEAGRGPPRPMQVFLHQEEHCTMAPAYENDEDLYELDAGAPLASGANGNTAPQTLSSGEWRSGHGERGVVQSDGDEDLAKAIELSQQEEFIAPRRTNTGGFDAHQIAEALNRSLLN